MLLEIHPLLTDRVRLSVMAHLISTRSEVTFNDLLTELELTKGNLSSHMKKLEEKEFIIVNKTFENKMPKTTYKLTKLGKSEFEKYLKSVSKLISQSK